MCGGGGYIGGPWLVILLPMMVACEVSHGLHSKVSSAKKESKNKIKSIYQQINPSFLKIQQDKLTAKIEIGKHALPKTKLAELYYRRAVCYFLCQMYEKALEDFESSFSKHSHFLHAYMCGSTHQIMGHYDKARSWFDEAMKLYDSYEEQMSTEGLDTVLSNWFRDTRDQVYIGSTKLRDNVSNLMTMFSKDLNQETKEKQKLDEDQIKIFENWKLHERNITKSDLYTCRAICSMTLSIDDLDSAISDFKAALSNYKDKVHKGLVLMDVKASCTHNLALSYLYARNLTLAKQYIDQSVTYLEQNVSPKNEQNYHAMKLKCLIKKLQWFIYQFSQEPANVVEKIRSQANDALSMLIKGVKVEECFYYRLFPCELFLSILEFLPHSTLGKIMQCDRSLYKLCLNSPQIWRTIHIDISRLYFKNHPQQLQDTLVSYIRRASFTFSRGYSLDSIEKSPITMRNKIEYVELFNCTFNFHYFESCMSMFPCCTHVTFKCVIFGKLDNPTFEFQQVNKIHFHDCVGKKETLLKIFKTAFPNASITYFKP